MTKVTTSGERVIYQLWLITSLILHSGEVGLGLNHGYFLKKRMCGPVRGQGK